MSGLANPATKSEPQYVYLNQPCEKTPIARILDRALGSSSCPNRAAVFFDGRAYCEQHAPLIVKRHLKRSGTTFIEAAK